MASMPEGPKRTFFEEDQPMRILLACLVLVSAGAIFLDGAVATGQGDKKEVTIKGSICCAKCALAKETTCMTVISEKKDGKDVIYYFAKDGHKKYHDDICGGAQDGTVKGVVTEKDGKKTIEVKELKYDK
jgi:hypothetical protein